MSVRVVRGDLLNSTEDFIAHQCNCVSDNPKTLAKVIFDRYSYANTYTRRSRSTPSTVGTIGICGRRSGRRKIINMYAQYYPAGPRGFDSDEARIQWFQECLDMIGQHTTGSIAMPYRIGCGAAQGNWRIYEQMIQTFASKYDRTVVLYKL